MMKGTQCSLPRCWRDAFNPDLFVTLAGGRSALRVEDLLALVELVDGLSVGDAEHAMVRRGEGCHYSCRCSGGGSVVLVEKAA
jgi:hypothetical protein